MWYCLYDYSGCPQADAVAKISNHEGTNQKEANGTNESSNYDDAIAKKSSSNHGNESVP